VTGRFSKTIITKKKCRFKRKKLREGPRNSKETQSKKKEKWPWKK